MAGGDGFHGVPDPRDIGEVHGGEVVVGRVEADAGEGDDEHLAWVELRVRVLLGEPVGVADLVGGGEPGEDDVGDGRERVRGARGVAHGDGPADAVGAGAAGGDPEREPRGEDAVGGAGGGEVERVGGEQSRRVRAEERGHLGDLHVGVERVAQQRRAGVRARARLDRRLRRRARENHQQRRGRGGRRWPRHWSPGALGFELREIGRAHV